MCICVCEEEDGHSVSVSVVKLMFGNARSVCGRRDRNLLLKT